MRNLRVALAAAVLLSISPSVFGQASFTSLYSQNFDALPSAPTIGITAPFSNNQIVGVFASATNNNPATTILVSNGTNNTGGVYSFGATGEAERALGSIGSGSASTNRLAIVLRNATASTINDLVVQFTGEQWRSSTTTQNVLTFDLGVFADTNDATQLNANLNSTTGYTANAALNYTGQAPVTTNGALNGNDPANRTLVNGNLSDVNFGAGQLLYLRFTDINDVGNDAGLAIDDFSVSAPTGAVPEPGTLALVVGGLLPMAAILIRRRWNATK